MIFNNGLDRPKSKRKTLDKTRQKTKRKPKRSTIPSLDIILNDVEKLGYRGTGRKYGVSDNCIRKWIIRHQSKGM